MNIFTLDIDLYKIQKKAKEMTMQNWKTTILGLVGAAFTAAANYAGQKPTWQGYVAAGVIGALGVFAKDFDIGLSAGEIATVKSAITKTSVLLLALSFWLVMPGIVRAQTATPTPAPAVVSNGFAATGGPVAINYSGTWSAASYTRESYDFLDFGAAKTNHLYLQGVELIMPTPGVNLYLGGVAYQPNISSLFSKTNVPPGAFSVFFDGNVGNGIPSAGASHISWLAGGGLLYKITGALSWTPLMGQYGRFGANGFEAISTNLQFVFGGQI